MRRIGVVALLAFSLAALFSCRSGVSAQVKVPEELRASLIAVYPFGFRWPEPAYRSFELSQRLISEVLEASEQRTLVVGPSEFQVWRAEDDNVLAASTLGKLLPPLQLRPKQVLVLRPWAEQRVHSSSRTLTDAKGRNVGAERVEETTYVGHVEVLHAASGERIVEVTGSVEVDPFAERTDEGADPAPELTKLMEALTVAAMEALEDHLSTPAEAADLSAYGFDLTPGAAFTYEEQGRPSATASLAQMDALDRELFVEARTRYANPERSAAELRPLLRAPAGLFVRTAPEGGLLRAGDVLTRVNGEPALPQTWVRARLSPGPDLLRVRRARGDYEEFTLP